MKFKLYFLLPLLAAGLAACDDDLDEQVYNVLTDSTAFTSAENAQAAVNAMYGPLQTIYRDPMFQASDGVTDICLALGVSDFEVLNDEGVRTSSHLTTCWNGFYQVVSRANIVVDRVGPMAEGLFQDEQYDRNQMLGEAHFMRAYAYLQLSDLFYQVPLVMTSDVDVAAKLPFAPVAEIEDSIESDLRKAIELLPLSYASNADGGRPTVGAARGYLVRLLMRQAGRLRQNGGDAASVWNKALTEVNKVLELEGSVYSLQPHVWDIYNPDSESTLYNNELMFAIRANYAGSNGTWDLGLMFTNWDYDRGWNLFVVPLEQYWKYEAGDERLTTLIVDEFPNTYNDPSNPAAATYYYAPATINDVTTISHSNLNADGTIKPGEEYGTIGELGSVFTRKYEYHNLTYTYQTHNNVPLLRFADMLMCKAEILNELNGPTQEAIDLINRIRERAFQNSDHNFVLGNYGSKEALRSAICDERAIEFGLECCRRVDLVRMGLWKDRMEKYFAAIKARSEMKEKNEGKDSGYYSSEWMKYPTNLTEDDVRRYMPVPKRETDYNPELANARTF